MGVAKTRYHSDLLKFVFGVSVRNVGLEPSQDTYSTLMCALAEKGDIEGIEEVSG